MKHLLTLEDLARNEILHLVDYASKIKEHSGLYDRKLKQKTLLMIFEKPSLRTRVSFETAMTQLGGHAIYLDASTSPLGGGKETISDTAKTASRYCNIITARLFKHSTLEELAENSSVPVINALTDFSHPCQILSDLLTIKEKKGTIENIKLAYFGDSNNNVTHSLIFAASMAGFDIAIACPKGKEYSPNPIVLKNAKKYAKKTGASIEIYHNAEQAAKDADVIYTDSWMSYHIPKEEKPKRVKVFKPFQVTKELMAKAKPDAIFMNCLPAKRGYEQTAEVIDGPQSVVFDQAENRLHMAKAILLYLLS